MAILATTRPAAYCEDAMVDLAGFDDTIAIRQVTYDGVTYAVQLDPVWTVAQLATQLNDTAGAGTFVADGSWLITPNDATGNGPIVLTTFVSQVLETYGTGGQNNARQSVANTTYNFSPSGQIIDGDYAVTSFQDTGLSGFNNADFTITADSQGDPTGNAFIVNADSQIGEVYRQTLPTIVGQEYAISFWAISTNSAAYNQIKPNLTIQIEDGASNIIGSVQTGDIQLPATWKQYFVEVVATTTTTEFVLISNVPGGAGNDFAVDHIEAGLSNDAAARQFVDATGCSSIAPTPDGNDGEASCTSWDINVPVGNTAQIFERYLPSTTWVPVGAPLVGTATATTITAPNATPAEGQTVERIVRILDGAGETVLESDVCSYTAPIDDQNGVELSCVTAPVCPAPVSGLGVAPDRVECCDPTGGEPATVSLDRGDSCLNQLFVEVCNPTVAPVQIIRDSEQLGCTVDANGEVTGRVFGRFDEANDLTLVRVDTTGTVTDPYTGTWVHCPTSQGVRTHAFPEAGCADGVPYIRRHVQVYDADDGSDLGAQNFYVDSAGTITTVAPANFTLGACPVAQREVMEREYTGVTEICVENPVGTFTKGYSRQLTEWRLTGLGVLTDVVTTQYTVDGVTWSATVPVGTITTGHCEEAVDTASHEIEYSGSIPVCVENPVGTYTQWYVRQRETHDWLAGGAELSNTTNEWTQDGVTFQNTLPAGTRTLGHCSVPVVPSTYVSAVFDVAAGTTASIAPLGNLISWTVRNRSSTTGTIQVNGGAILLMDAGETVGSGDVEEEGGTLTDTVNLVASNGILRVTTLRRS